MRNFNITVAVSVDDDDESHANLCLTSAFGNLLGNAAGAIKILETRKQNQVPALFRHRPDQPIRCQA